MGTAVVEEVMRPAWVRVMSSMLLDLRNRGDCSEATLSWLFSVADTVSFVGASAGVGAAAAAAPASPTR